MAFFSQISPNKGYRVPNPNAEFTDGIGEFGCTDFNLSAESYDRSTFTPLDTHTTFQPVFLNSLEFFI